MGTKRSFLEIFIKSRQNAGIVLPHTLISFFLLFLIIGSAFTVSYFNQVPGVSEDDAKLIHVCVAYAKGEPGITLLSSNARIAHPNFPCIWMAPAFSFFGVTPSVLHLSQAFWGALAAGLFYLLAWQLLNSQLAAFLAAFFLALSPHYSVNSQILHGGDVLFWFIFTMLLAVLAFQSSLSTLTRILASILVSILAGVALGITLHMYVATRILPGIVIIIFLSFLSQSFRFSTFLKLLLLIISTLATLTPLFLSEYGKHFLLSPEQYTFETIQQVPRTLEYLLSQIKMYLPGETCPASSMVSHSSSSNLTWLTIGLFLLGFTKILGHFSPSHSIIISTLFLSTLPVILSFKCNSHRSMFVPIGIYLIVGVAIVRLLRNSFFYRVRFWFISGLCLLQLVLVIPQYKHLWESDLDIGSFGITSTIVSEKVKSILSTSLYFSSPSPSPSLVILNSFDYPSQLLLAEEIEQGQVVRARESNSLKGVTLNKTTTFIAYGNGWREIESEIEKEIEQAGIDSLIEVEPIVWAGKYKIGLILRVKDLPDLPDVLVNTAIVWH